MLRIVLVVMLLLAPISARAQVLSRCTDLLPTDHVRNHDRAGDVLRDARRLHRRERRLMGVSFAFMALAVSTSIPAALMAVFPSDRYPPRPRGVGIVAAISLTSMVGTSTAGAITGLALDRCLRRAHFITPDAPLRGRRPHSGALIASFVPPLDAMGPFFLLGHVVRRGRLLGDLELRFAPPVAISAP
jgi:hypothetical protein